MGRATRPIRREWRLVSVDIGRDHHKIDSALSTEYQGIEGDKLDPTFRAEEKVHQIVKPLDPVKVEQLPVQYDDPMEFGDAPTPEPKAMRRRRAYTISELVALPTPEWQVKGMFSENCWLCCGGRRPGKRSWPLTGDYPYRQEGIGWGSH